MGEGWLVGFGIFYIVTRSRFGVVFEFSED